MYTIKSIIKLLFFNPIKRINIQYKKRKYLFLIEPEIFNGKRIAIIGPADSALTQKNGDFIDGFDIIIRLNKSLEIIEEHTQFIGTKTTFLAHCMDESDFTGCGKIDTKTWKHHGVQKIFYLLNEKRFDSNFDNFFLKKEVRLPVCQIDKKDYLSIKKYLNGKIPTTGFAALFLLLNSNCSQLYITGFTFFKTSYQEGYRPKFEDISEMRKIISDHDNHDIDKEFKIIRDLINSSNLDILTDETLSKLLLE